MARKHMTAADNRKNRIRYFRWRWFPDKDYVRGKNGKPIYYDTWLEALKEHQIGEQILKERY